MSAWGHAGLGPAPVPIGSAAELVQAYASGQRNPVEIVERLGQRLEAADLGDAGASPFSDLCLERALCAAGASARRWRDGRPRGPLDGVPVPLKDQHDVAGLPTRAGVRTRLEPARRDGALVRRLEAAGALVPGKTHSTEWGLCPVGRSAHAVLPANPFDARHAAGGSSTGAGVAVSLGLVPAALGSDAGGSIRIPAALSGLFALKPGREPERYDGDLFGRGSLTVNGPIGRGSGDLATLLEVLGHAPAGGALGRGVTGCRIGIVEQAWRIATSAAARCGVGLLEGLEAEGARLEACAAPLLVGSRKLGVAVVLAEGGLALEAAARQGELGPQAARSLDELRAGDWPPPGSIPRAREALASEVMGLMERFDLLALPTTLDVAPLLGDPTQRVTLLDEADNQRLCATTFAANLCGLPAGTMPAGTVRGLPVGLQLLGRRAGDILAVMAHAERAGLSLAARPAGWAPY